MRLTMEGWLIGAFKVFAGECENLSDAVGEMAKEIRRGHRTQIEYRIKSNREKFRKRIKSSALTAKKKY